MKKSSYALFIPLFLALSLAACTFDAEEWATVTTFAGQAGVMGSVNGTGTEATFNSPEALAVDSYGNVYVGDSGNSKVRMITAAGVVTDFAQLGGSARGMACITIGGTDILYVSDHHSNKINKYILDDVLPPNTLAIPNQTIGTGSSSPVIDGPYNEATFNGPSGLAVDENGNVYVADMWNSRIRKIDPNGNVTTLAGGTKGRKLGTGAAAQLSEPVGIAISTSADGTFLFVADTWNHCIRAVSLTGEVTAAAGRPGSWGYNDGEGNVARIGLPQLMASDRNGNVYFTDKMIMAVRQITPGHLESAPVDSPAYLYPPNATDNKKPDYPANNNNRPQKMVGRLISTVAGLGAWCDGTTRFAGRGYANGTNEEARFNFAQKVDDPTQPTGKRDVGGAGIAVTARGVIYVADTGNHVIRKITP